MTGTAFLDWWRRNVLNRAINILSTYFREKQERLFNFEDT
jgi:hypothetical protein